MTRIRPSAHRLLDGLTVVGFAVAPPVLRLSGAAAWLALALSVVHLLMTLATAFPGRASGFVPLRWHGLVELLVGITLPAVPFVAGWVGTARWFYLIAGAVILTIRLGSQFTVPRPGARTA